MRTCKACWIRKQKMRPFEENSCSGSETQKKHRNHLKTNRIFYQKHNVLGTDSDLFWWSETHKSDLYHLDMESYLGSKTQAHYRYRFGNYVCLAQKHSNFNTIRKSRFLDQKHKNVIMWSRTVFGIRNKSDWNHLDNVFAWGQTLKRSTETIWT